MSEQAGIKVRYWYKFFQLYKFEDVSKRYLF